MAMTLDGALTHWLGTKVPDEADFGAAAHASPSSMKASLGNLSAGSLDQQAATIRDRLRRIQRQPGLITGFLRQTGLTLESEPP